VQKDHSGDREVTGRREAEPLMFREGERGDREAEGVQRSWREGILQAGVIARSLVKDWHNTKFEISECDNEGEAGLQTMSVEGSRVSRGCAFLASRCLNCFEIAESMTKAMYLRKQICKRGIDRTKPSSTKVTWC